MEGGGERENERERERERGVASRMHPDWESNPQPFSVRDSDSTNRATRPGQHCPSIQGKHNYTGSLPQPQGHGLEFLHLSDSHSLSPSGRPAQPQGAGLELPGCSGLSPGAHTGGRQVAGQQPGRVSRVLPEVHTLGSRDFISRGQSDLRK